MAQTDPAAHRSGAGFWTWTKSRTAREVFRLCRWVHVYLSTALFGLLVFFSFTGLLLNHLSWFEHDGPLRELSEPLPQDLITAIRDSEDPPLQRLELHIEAQLGLKDPRKIDLDLEVGELIFDYPLPGGYALVTIDSRSGLMRTEHQQGTVLALLNDLHKGRHSGKSWSLVIDISAILMIAMSLTGLVILLQQAKWRMPGLLVVVAGFLLPWLVFLLWVPRVL